MVSDARSVVELRGIVVSGSYIILTSTVLIYEKKTKNKQKTNKHQQQKNKQTIEEYFFDELSAEYWL
jgi:hypothetical protein